MKLGEGNGTPLQYSCLENPMDGGAWKAAVHGVAEGRTRLSDFTFTFHFHALEKEMATHSSVLAWRTPGTEESGGLPSMGSQSWTRLKQLSSSSSNVEIQQQQELGRESGFRSASFSTLALLAAAAAAKSLQSCPTLYPIDSPPGSPVPGILQARTLEWVAISFSNA